MTSPLRQTRFKIGGMDCASCAAKIATAVRRLDGVADVSVSVTGASMTVSHGGPLNDDKVLRQVAWLGYGIVKAEARTDGPAAKAHDHVAHDHEGHDRQDHDHEGHDHGGGQEITKEAAGASHLHSHAEPGQVWWRSRRAALTLACAAALLAAYSIGHLFPSAERWVFLAALLVGLVPIARRALMAALAGTPFSIEMLMTIAAAGAVMINATEEAAAVVVLFLIGELLEGVAAGRARASIQGLADLVPKTALVERGGGTVEVPAEQLAVGHVIVVRPGDRIPADGEIVEGSSDIDEAPVTGESTPKRKGVAEPVFAGTINSDGVLKVRVTAAASDNTIARVVRLVEEAQEAKAPTERFIDRFSRYYTPGVLAVGALVAVLPPLVAGGDWNEWIYKGLAILLIGCPCALVISTPAAIAAGLATGARRGLLMKGGAVLEGFRRITAVAFDKTGTLTVGKPVVTDIVAFGRDERSVLALAAALEQGSSHPLAVAILDRARADKAPVPPAFAAKAGRGVEGSVGGVAVFLGSGPAAGERADITQAQRLAVDSLNGQGKTVSVLVADGVVAGLIAMRDEPRPDAAAGIAALKAEGIRAVMLTGDNRRIAEAIAASLGIEARAELLPQDKQRIVGELQGEGLTVAKVGDGINDAPALAAADIGIAMGGGTDVALETADAAILHGRVLDVARMVRLSRAVMANISQNITVALGLKAVFLVTTISGITGLGPAILADTGATVLVTANAMRLLRWRG
ncbi:heavy metal translocating P-type ATPase [Mesorhizobium erdmanii]|uniref:P-type Zn(2+) transporter n=2 Tax=Mesorhizobium TaxID=68287 RepID=A0A3M9XG09_9HYPH|nr:MULTISPECIES: heavy metal translocating P-type ATPase [Mesorhizobium]RNJ46884.1 cadmium-translocating P-type ATPase [Mesorhizobium japonicum]RXT34112.1 heavy metal translocating P-type ATPase [Mesorhizobium erdmanii]